MTEQAVEIRKPQKRGVKTVRRVLDAAHILMADGGFDAVQLSHISKESGVSIGSLYHHFGSKEGIITRLVDEFNARAMTDLANLDLTGLPFEERLRRLLDLTCAQFRDNPELYRSMAERVKSTPNIWVPLRALRSAFEARMSDELSDGLRQHGVSDPKAAIHRMTQTVLGVLTHSVVFGSGPARPDDPLLEDQIYAIGYAVVLLPTP
ncbi:TetR/AcrR family transcriptional regulator [Aliiroseovarius sp. F47248L]|uniref:TetR/AcrR family transcriptional regulator n=1 Tax=Aliiroseovarius sp. F47248L TaxID=2926420 RepID=UPI001FF145EE|nr:TetR/AcrR family transcriptional regulator [Aliiroseovarius sp. F47248L]